MTDGARDSPVGDVASPIATWPQPRLSRRRLLIGTGVVGGAALTGSLLLTGSWEHQRQAAGAVTSPTTAGPLVLVTLYGGNDGFNTVIPFNDSAYHAARPTLGYRPPEVLDLDDGLGLNPKLAGLQSLWRAKQLAVVRGLGYPNPNLSHFASMDIWQTANPSDGTGPGWLGRWLDATGHDPMRAISIGATLPPLLRGDKESATAITSAHITLPGPPYLETAYSSMQAAGADRGSLAGLVAGAGRDLLAAKGQLDGLRATSGEVAATVDRNGRTGTGAGSDLAGQLDIVAALINAGATTRVYQVSLSSFDTHSGEKANHERLLTELDGALTGFLRTITATAAGRRAVVMTFSEFGRRLAENASGGTDHGAAAPLFVAGHEVRGGQFYGEEPSLDALDANGNARYTVDFRSVYATVLERVVGVDSATVLGKRFATLPFV